MGKIDLNEERTFKELLLAFENDKVRSFHIDVSNDDNEYTTIYTSEDKTEGHDKDTTVTLEEAVTARYVKVTVDSLISERIQVFQCMK
ncbi:MAG: discoidin domain-containing protein [Thomasclavelia spiroformis]